MHSAAATPPALLAAALRTDAARPLLTSYDDTTGQRVDLSVATVANWVAKLGNAMADEWGLGPGNTVAIDLPAHWVGAVCALAVWSAGGEVAGQDDSADAAVRLGEPPALTETELVVTLAPMGLDLSGLVAGWPDQLVTAGPPGGAAAVSAATAAALPDRARLLSTLPLGAVGTVVTSVVAPLAVAGSVVLVRAGGEVDAGLLAVRCAAENVTHTAGVDVPGLPRIG